MEGIELLVWRHIQVNYDFLLEGYQYLSRLSVLICKTLPSRLHFYSVFPALLLSHASARLLMRFAEINSSCMSKTIVLRRWQMFTLRFNF
jgi:hypothetical protein